MAAESSCSINYDEFFIFPHPPPKSNKDYVANLNEFFDIIKI